MYIQNVHELHKLVSQIIKQRWLQVCNDRTYYTKLLLNFDFSRIYHSIQSNNIVEIIGKHIILKDLKLKE